MDANDAPALIREIVEVGWNEGNLSVIDRRIARDFVRHTALGDMAGPEVFKDRIIGMRAAFAGFHTEIHEVGGDHLRGFGRFTVCGEHTGAYLGYEPTGNQISFVGAVIAHAEGGQLVEEWEYFDTAAFLGQLQGT